MKKHTRILTVLLSLWALAAHANLSDLLISEIAITPTEGEFIEIHNKGGNVIDLTDVYLTDATYPGGGGTYYYQLVSGGGGGGGFADFYARFPAGASIAPGAYQTIALNGAVDFNNLYGVDPTYEIANTNAVPDMLEARIGSIDGLSSGLSGGGEVVVLLHWDGQSDLMQDLDYVLWGDKNEAVSKTGISIDGPDADGTPTSYLDDTDITSQAVVSASSHASGMSWQRSDMNEGNETKTGGNGISGHDETSEDTNNTFFEDTPTPNAAAGNPPAPQIIINEVDAVGSAEFIELTGPANVSTSGITLVMYDGATDQIYDVYDLSGYQLSADGYLLIGDAGLSPDIVLPAGSLQDGPDAVAIYYADASQFTIGDGITSTDIMDALVYDSGQADDAGLLALINNGEPQINENENADATNQSMARCPNASGGSLNSSTYQAVDPTPGLLNNLCPIGDYYATADDTNATTLRNSLHEIIDDHTSFPYSNDGIDDTWEVLSFADEDPTDPSKVWMIYKNNSYTYNGGGQQPYNREHTWPQSYGFSSGALGSDNTARTDAHHLMMSDVGYNGNRGNLYFDNCDSGCTNDVTTANHGQGGPGINNKYDSNSYEVWDFRKGDIARAMFYMDVRYAGDVSGEVDLQLTDNAGLIQTGDPYMGLLSTLIQWHNQDPVDSYELERNERVYSYQGNRNPFIDHPEWVECIFINGGQCTTVADDLIFKNGFE
ncbi:hypothetical protein GCM10011365_00950 [Marinicella pacifica]|uniref:LTD domain-containing protein n=1 Tax=Marinicella pacifica TaxID=1171543 RepID=A0A917CCQ2_9GAMM|nr:endonuclease [Marinicella pacifica]GGF83783.1 hypothetical protein GCM10011365_00950 [Marinicella pacifica]